jgi:hypothetical protein
MGTYFYMWLPPRVILKSRYKFRFQPANKKSRILKNVIVLWRVEYNPLPDKTVWNFVLKLTRGECDSPSERIARICNTSLCVCIAAWREVHCVGAKLELVGLCVVKFVTACRPSLDQTWTRLQSVSLIGAIQCCDFEKLHRTLNTDCRQSSADEQTEKASANKWTC